MVGKKSKSSSVTLIVLGVDLEPGVVTRALSMFPDQAWRKGEAPKIRTPDDRWIRSSGIAEWGGWKKFIPATLLRRSLEVQLDHWSSALASKANAVAVF